jgi:aminotransferase
LARFLSSRLEGLVQSDIRYMTRECQRLGGINLGQGLCDLPTPPAVRDGAIAAIRAREARYTVAEGIPALREAIAEKLARDNGIEADPERGIVVTSGTTGAFATVLTALLEPGDGVLMTEPYYGYHRNTAVVLGMTPELWPLEAPDFELDEATLRRAVTPRTRVVVLCTPANPYGRMLRRGEIETVARVAREHDLLVVSDEIYEYFTYDGREHLSPATLADLRERTITIMGLSKTFHITGWRVGYLVAPREWIEPLILVNDLLYVCAPTPLQHGVLAGFADLPEKAAALRRDFQHKRDRLCEALAEAGLPPIVPEGSYYVLADVSGVGYRDARAAAMDLLERGGVAAIPGSAFYESRRGEGLLRLSFGVEDDTLDAACRRIRAFRPKPG